MARPSVCMWLVVAFDSKIRDPREYLQVVYDGVLMHIKPSRDDSGDLISVFVEPPQEMDEIQVKINRFLSAMAWKDGHRYVTLGCIASGASLAQKDKPRFNYRHSRTFPGGIIDRYDFEHLQCPIGEKQKRALALYREGLNTNTDFYKLLSFFKILNITLDKGSDHIAWINANADRVWDVFAKERLQKLKGTVRDIGRYLWTEGRAAVAHAFSKPIRDPDVPTDIAAVRQDADLMRGLAEIFIEEELGVPSLRKIWREHLYELEGFKRLLGETLVARLKAGEYVPVSDFPTFPALTLGLKQRDGYEAFQNLHFKVESCKEGWVHLLTTDAEPVHVALVLDFPRETLEFLVDSLGINREHEKYRRSAEASLHKFLVDYFCNGCLEIFNAASEERLSHKNAFLPFNIDVSTTIENWRARIAELEAAEKSNNVK